MAIEVVADLSALSQWASEAQIASGALEPRRSRSGTKENVPRGSKEVPSVRGRTSVARSSTCSRLTKMPSVESVASSDHLSRATTRHNTPSLEAMRSLPALVLPVEDAGSPQEPSLELMPFSPASPTSPCSTYANDQLVLVPKCASSPSRLRKMKSDLLRSHPWLRELQQAAAVGSLPSSPMASKPRAARSGGLPPLEQLALQLHSGQKMEVETYQTPRSVVVSKEMPWLAGLKEIEKQKEMENILQLPFKRNQGWSSKDERELLEQTADSGQMQTGILPASIRALDYWRATELFQLFDRRTGDLDKLGFFHLLTAASRDKELITRGRSDAIFSEIDIDGSGNIDKEEFLGWVFQTNNSFLSSVRRKLETMDQNKVKSLFQQMDIDGNNSIDVDEFWEFVEKFSPGMLSRQASDELHEFIDADKSGGIEVDEFLNWVHPGRELHLLRAEVGEKEGSMTSMAANVVTGYVAPKKPLMETEPGRPVVLQFWIGSEWSGAFKAIKRSLRSVFSSNQIQFDLVRDKRVQHTCSKLIAKVGRGIVLWDRDKMLAFKDDPFMNQATAGNWIRDVLLQCLPDVINAANVRLLKRKKLNVCFECGKNLETARFMNVLEYKVCSKACATLLKARAVPG